jgi:hypothetical protein
VPKDPPKLPQDFIEKLKLPREWERFANSPRFQAWAKTLRQFTLKLGYLPPVLQHERDSITREMQELKAAEAKHKAGETKLKAWREQLEQRRAWLDQELGGDVAERAPAAKPTSPLVEQAPEPEPAPSVELSAEPPAESVLPPQEQPSPPAEQMPSSAEQAPSTEPPVEPALPSAKETLPPPENEKAEPAPASKTWDGPQERVIVEALPELYRDGVIPPDARPADLKRDMIRWQKEQAKKKNEKPPEPPSLDACNDFLNKYRS